MAKFYFKYSEKEEKHLVPSRRTIDFLLSYSKSLKVLECQNFKFETILN